MSRTNFFPGFELKKGFQSSSSSSFFLLSLSLTYIACFLQPEQPFIFSSANTFLESIALILSLTAAPKTLYTGVPFSSPASSLSELASLLSASDFFF